MDRMLIRTIARCIMPLWVLLQMASASASAALTEAVEISGSVLRVFLPAAAWAGTYVEDDRQGRAQFYWSMGTTVATTIAVKNLADREGPNGQPYAFPSGHASMAFSAASFVQKRYGWQYGAPMYGLAAFVGWSRVYADQRRTEDVLAGAALGMASSYLFTDRRDGGPTASFSADDDAYRFQLAMIW